MRNRSITFNIPKVLSIKEEIIKLLMLEKEPLPISYFYNKFDKVSKRVIREHFKELYEKELIIRVKCPCHVSFLYTI